MDSTSTVDDVIKIVTTTLGIEDRIGSLDATTALLDSMPEFDSMAVVELVVAIEEHFGFEIDEADISGEVFETIGTLAAFVDQSRP